MPGSDNSATLWNVPVWEHSKGRGGRGRRGGGGEGGGGRGKDRIAEWLPTANLAPPPRHAATRTSHHNTLHHTTVTHHNTLHHHTTVTHHNTLHHTTVTHQYHNTLHTPQQSDNTTLRASILHITTACIKTQYVVILIYYTVLDSGMILLKAVTSSDLRNLFSK